MKKTRSFVVVASIVGLAATGGCASNQKTQDELNTLRAQINQVSEAATRAADEAAAAKITAEKANRTAEAARTEAADAAREARSARGIAVDTESKIDRMFKKAMYK